MAQSLPAELYQFYATVLTRIPGWAFFCVLFLGAGMVGSFLNVCVWRIPRGQSIVTPRSRCPRCQHALYVIDLIPVLSWLSTGGKCRYCKVPVSLRYQVVELTNITLWTLAWLAFGRTHQMLAAGALASTALGVLGVRWMKQSMAAAEAAASAGEGEAEGGAAAQAGGEAAPPDEAEREAGGAPVEVAASPRAGFTFLEIMFVAGILAAVVAPFLQVVQVAFVGSGKNRDTIQAFNLAREKIEELRVVPVEQLRGDWDIYVAGETNIFADEFFGPYARMKSSPKAFYKGFSDVWTEEHRLTDTVRARFEKAFEAYHGFAYEAYPRHYARYRRTTQVEDLTDPKHPNNVLKKITVRVETDTKNVRSRPVELVAYASNR